MAKKTIFLHIGAMKTGTSAIQNVLYQKQNKLAQTGLFIPTLSKRARNYLGFSLLSPVPDFIHTRLPEPAGDLYKQLNTEIDQCAQKTVVISTESWYQISTSHLLGAEAPRQLHRLLGGERSDRTYKVVFFIRRQDRLMESIYNQHIKNNNLYSLLQSPFSEFMDHYSGYADLEGITRSWESVFGREAIVLIPYTERKTNSVALFFDQVGVAIPEGISADTVNESLTNRESELMRHLNMASVDKSTWQRNLALVQFINKWSGETQKGFNYFSPDERSAFMNRYQEANHRLSLQYLAGDTSWFTDPVTIPEGGPAEPITAKDFARFAASLWSHISDEEILRIIQKPDTFRSENQRQK
ncbi:MAG: hypothetical protein HUU10_12705 [Bacteroidetes bacterium]|nr:hypothetical protein [Bacteroidota bacterium]